MSLHPNARHRQCDQGYRDGAEDKKNDVKKKLDEFSLRVVLRAIAVQSVLTCLRRNRMQQITPFMQAMLAMD